MSQTPGVSVPKTNWRDEMNKEAQVSIGFGGEEEKSEVEEAHTTGDTDASDEQQEPPLPPPTAPLLHSPLGAPGASREHIPPPQGHRAVQRGNDAISTTTNQPTKHSDGVGHKEKGAAARWSRKMT